MGLIEGFLCRGGHGGVILCREGDHGELSRKIQLFTASVPTVGSSLWILLQKSLSRIRLLLLHVDGWRDHKWAKREIGRGREGEGRQRYAVTRGLESGRSHIY